MTIDGSILGGRILVVDDMPTNLRLLASILSDRYQVSAASNGRDALRLAERVQPDLIILDVEMPGMNGHEVCRTLKEKPEFRHVPIIFLTGRSDEADEILGLQLGAVDYITKPFNQAVVRARIHTHLELKRYSDLLQRHAFIDGLTGLPNRRRLDQYLNELSTGERSGADSLSVLMIDVDFFKAYNDRYGHLAGDHCLREVAATLAAARRRGDDLLARYGGEEFALLMPGADRTVALDQAQRLRDAMLRAELPHRDQPDTGQVTISVGTSSGALSAEPAQALIERADRALYQAKKEGRNRVVQL